MRRQRNQRTMADEIYEAERRISRARGRWAFAAVMICLPLWFIGVCWVGGHTPSEVIDIFLMHDQVEYKDPSDKLKSVEDDTSNTNKYETEENVWYYNETPEENTVNEQTTEYVQEQGRQESGPAHDLPGITEEQIQQQESSQAEEVQEYNDEVNERSNEEYEKEWEEEHASSEVYSSSTVTEVEDTESGVEE